MKLLNKNGLLLLVVLVVFGVFQVNGKPEKKTCTTKKSSCFLKTVVCPPECPSTKPASPKSKVCFLNCYSPVCKAECKNRKPNCKGPGAACLDPRFIGGDGGVFYFHGRRNEHFSLVSDPNLQINARFIGLRPQGRTRDYTWIQALGILFNVKSSFALEATKASKWDQNSDHLSFSHNGKEINLPEGYLSVWESPEKDLIVERTSDQNSVLVTLPEILEISVNVVPVTKEDDRIHNYQVPEDDCFAHLEVQFRFFGLSSNVEGVLGRTYRPDFENSAKLGVAMPVVGGEEKYKTTSLLSADCKACSFLPNGVSDKTDTLLLQEFGTIDCGRRLSSGNGVVCKK